MSEPEKVEASPLAYRGSDAAERARIRAWAVNEYRGRIAGLARALLQRWPEAWEDAEQAGVIGLLVALDRLAPERTDENFDFWAFVHPYAKNEIQKWADKGLFYRPRRQRAEMARFPTDGEKIDERIDRGPSPEEQVAEAEGVALVEEFLAEQDEKDLHLLTCEKRNRATPGNNSRSKRYSLLVERARERVLQGSGEHADQSGDSLRSGRDTVRP